MLSVLCDFDYLYSCWGLQNFRAIASGEAIHSSSRPSFGRMRSMQATIAQLSPQQWLSYGAVITISYAISRCIYLLYFHPLAKFPGPKVAAVSNLWYAYHWFSGRYPWTIEKVLEQYGDVVRIAPNEVVFMRPQAAVDILMSGTKQRPTFIKTDFQHIGGEHAGIAADPDVEKHRAVRKMLAPAFNPRALKEQEPALHEHIDRFIRQLEKLGTGEQGVDMREVSTHVSQ